MHSKQLVVVAVVALLSGGLGVVVTSRMASKDVQPAPRVADARPVDLDPIVDRLEHAHASANEAAAIATLRSIASAQAQAQALGIVDVDGDSVGEYAWFAELAGTAPLRCASGAGGELLQPPLLASAFGQVSATGTVERSGYVYWMYLPGASAGGRIQGLPESRGGPAPDPDNSEVLWCVYAWPTEAGKSGARAFFLNQEGDLLGTANGDRAYSGESSVPDFDAAFDSAFPRDMASELPDASLRRARNDGRVWSLVGL